MTDQDAFTAVVPIEPSSDNVDKLKEFLSAIGDVVDEKACPIDFREMKSVHYLRWVIDDGFDDFGKRVTPRLIFEANFDVSGNPFNPASTCLDELARVGGETVRKIYSHCVGFTPNTDLIGYLRKHSLPYAAFYMGTRGRTVGDIRNEQKLRDEIQSFLQVPGNASGAAVAIRDRIRDHVFKKPEFDWAKDSRNRFGWWLTRYSEPLAFVFALLGGWGISVALGAPWWAVPAGLLALLILLLIAFKAWQRMIEAYERRDRSDEVSNPIGHVQKLTEREDQLVQNQLTHVVSIKPQWFRRRTVRTVLWAIDLLGRYVYNRGALGGIPSIHFARWVVIADGKRLLFMSNFDGSWENYLGDFIDKAAPGLTAIWSNTMGCPRSEGLIGAGARDEQRFKSWTREHQIFTQVWYSAYESLSVQNINNNSKIRDGLLGTMTAEQTKEWLALL